MTSGGVVEDEKNRSVATDYQHQQQPPHPPPFQGVSNYPPPQQQPPPPGYPQPAQPYVSGEGSQTGATLLKGKANNGVYEWPVTSSFIQLGIQDLGILHHLF